MGCKRGTHTPKWTAEEREKFREELRNGKTLQQIGNENGISRQRVAQLVGAVQPMKQWYKTYSVYPAIDSWLKYNRITITTFTQMLGYAANANNQNNVSKRLMGKVNLQKDFIDAVLKVTGLKYEEAFKERE